MSHLSRVDCGPSVMNAVNIDAGREDIRIASQRQCSQSAAERRAPDSNAARIDVGPGLKVFASLKDVAIFRGASRAGIVGKLECLAVSDTETVIDREDNEAAAREILIGSVIIGVFPA